MAEEALSLWELMVQDADLDSHQAEEACLSLPQSQRDQRVAQELVIPAVTSHLDAAMDLIGHVSSFTVVARTMAAAFEANWPEGAHRVQHAYRQASQVDGAAAQQKATDYSLHVYALTSAIEERWTVGIDALLERLPEIRGDEQYRLNYEGNPLLTAVRLGQGDLLKRLADRTPQHYAHVVDFALDAAAHLQRPDMLDTLWAKARPTGRLAAVKRGGWAPVGSPLDVWLLAKLDASFFQTVPKADTVIKELLESAFEHHKTAWVKRLASLRGDLRADDSWALRCAVVYQHDEAIAWLLPFSDPQAARHFWLSRKKPQWPLVDQLGAHLPEDQRAAWCHRQEHRLPQTVQAMQSAVAQQRAHTALTEHPVVPSHRRRLRS